VFPPDLSRFLFDSNATVHKISDNLWLANCYGRADFAGAAQVNWLSLSGSAQEFVETRILGCFLKSDEFGLGDRHALGLEQQVDEILVASTCAPQEIKNRNAIVM
jgi:hypothetical protein